MGKNVPKLRFKGFEGEWEEKRLGDICEVIMGQSPNGDSYNTEKNGIGLINGPAEFTEKYPIIIQYTSKPTKYCESGDVLLCVRGSSIGRMNVSDAKYCIGRGIAAIRYSHKKTEREYVYQLMQSIINKLLKLSSGSTFPNITGEEIKNFEVKLPSLQEQEKIANLLSKVDRYIELQEKKVSELEKYKKGMMQKIFSQKIRFRKDDGGEYPEWEEKRLGDVCTIYGRIGFRGYTVQDIVEKDKGVISLSPSNIVNSKLIINLDNTYISRFKYEESPEIKVFNGDILFVKTASIGRCALVKGLNEDATINPQLVVLKNIKISNKLLSEILLLPIIQQQVNKSKGGGVIPTLTQKEISSYKIFVPNSLEEQEKIAKFLSKVDLLIEKQSDRLEELKMWKKGLLQKMFV